LYLKLLWLEFDESEGPHTTSVVCEDDITVACLCRLVAAVQCGIATAGSRCGTVPRLGSFRLRTAAKARWTKRRLLSDAAFQHAPARCADCECDRWRTARSSKHLWSPTCGLNWWLALPWIRCR